MADPTGMRKRWDERAKEDAFFYVDNRLQYGKPDVEQFWAEGLKDLVQLLDLAGTQVETGTTVVDIGCGLGRLTRAVKTLGAGSVYAIDISREMLDRAQDLNADLEDITWVHGDGVSLAGIPSGVADAVISHVVFQHIPDPRVTLGYVREICRVLRPGGWAAFQVSNDPTLHRRATVGWRERVRRVARRSPKRVDDPSWVGSAVDLDELRATASDAGASVDRINGAGTQFCIVSLRRRG